MSERKPWDEYFFDVARMVSSRSTCPRASIGAVLILQHRIIGTGYNGVPSGEPHCEDTPEHAALDHCRAAVHAEINALQNSFADPDGATLYVVGARRVCPSCADHLHRAGVGDIRWSAS